jgi:hypothetical protein
MGRSPGSLQSDAIEGIYKIISYIGKNADEFDGDLKTPFIKAICDCEGYDRIKLGKIFSECKSAVEGWSGNSSHSKYERISEIIEEIQEVSKDTYV